MSPCVIALQELLNICHSYSISLDVNFNPLKSFCIGFTPKLYKLSLLKISINSAHIPYTDSIKYLGFTFTSSHKEDNDIHVIRQMRILYADYARSNRIVRLFHSCSTDVLLELDRSFCGSFYCSHLWTSYKKSSFSKIHVAYMYNNFYSKLVVNYKTLRAITCNFRSQQCQCNVCGE